MRTILITGGTGFVGKRLSVMLAVKGYRVIILTRKPPAGSDNPNISFAAWNPAKGEVDQNSLAVADVIIHLAGAGVMDRSWTPGFRQEILISRTESLRLLFRNLGGAAHKPKVLISASATGWYDAVNFPGKIFTEADPPAKDFLGEVCRQWEAAADEGAALNMRVCKLRTGIVLGPGGGAYPSFRKPLNAGLATIMGSGRQMVPWIHLDDLCRIYIHCIEADTATGPYNASGPQAVTNRQLVETIAKEKNGKFFITVPAPAFALKLMLGERSIELLKSIEVSAAKIQDAGFEFDFPDIESAVANLESVL